MRPPWEYRIELGRIFEETAQDSSRYVLWSPTGSAKGSTPLVDLLNELGRDRWVFDKQLRFGRVQQALLFRRRLVDDSRAELLAASAQDEADVGGPY